MKAEEIARGFLTEMKAWRCPCGAEFGLYKEPSFCPYCGREFNAVAVQALPERESAEIIICDGCRFSFPVDETRSTYCIRCRRMEKHLAERATPERQALVELLSCHWVTEIKCDHKAKTDIAFCACGWRGNVSPSVFAAVEEWAEHVAEARGRAMAQAEMEIGHLTNCVNQRTLESQHWSDKWLKEKARAEAAELRERQMREVLRKLVNECRDCGSPTLGLIDEAESILGSERAK